MFKQIIVSLRFSKMARVISALGAIVLLSWFFLRHGMISYFVAIALGITVLILFSRFFRPPGFICQNEACDRNGEDMKQIPSPPGIDPGGRRYYQCPNCGCRETIAYSQSKINSTPN